MPRCGKVIPLRGIVLPDIAYGVVLLPRPTNGPDWVDVCMYLLALDSLHGCKTAVTITVNTLLAKETATVALLSVWDTLPGSTEPMMVTTERQVSSSELQRLPEVVYNGLYAHDFSIGEAYRQTKFIDP